ncbi:hypothetical protein Patl1_22184 [Pistacia atlantica]|uniref:Uncharacterized protein n=1 Tax=Pistacia atlantica TaxID=434234 RepID=A0ACC1BJD5_9ROSI|nr:hypothetical protein Patl1_22184 [Pistacia atlantica]
MVMLRRKIWLSIVVVSIISAGVEGRTLLSKEEEDEEIEQQLKALNKPALKTIKTEHGDIIDCVDIYKQPAFDHPLLKNHTIQMEPSSFPEELKRQGTPLSSSNFMKMKLRGTSCPRGTVPIPRIQKEDLIRLKSLSQRKEAYFNSNNDDSSTQIADCNIQAHPNKSFSGGSALFSVYNPILTSKDDYSATTLWVQNFNDEQYNSIEVGWTVDPVLYGDSITRLYTRWTADSGRRARTGCYNILCPGFVQVGPYPVSQVLLPIIHDPHGGSVLDVVVFKDIKTKNWWFARPESKTAIGYWPASLFNIMKDEAHRIAWGGQTYSPKDDGGVEMGSGLFLSKQELKTCFAAKLQFVDETNHYMNPSPYKVETYTSNPNCYGVEYRGYTGPALEFDVLFGGPGGLKCRK